MQILTRLNKVIAYSTHGYVPVGNSAICVATNECHDNALITTVDCVPTDIDQYDYYYIDGKFIKGDISLKQLRKEFESFRDGVTNGSVTVAKATSATSASSASKATSATSATKATSDGNGKNISDTYAKLNKVGYEVKYSNVVFPVGSIVVVRDVTKQTIGTKLSACSWYSAGDEAGLNRLFYCDAVGDLSTTEIDNTAVICGLLPYQDEDGYYYHIAQVIS